MISVKTAVFLGDSITMGYGLSDFADRFSTVFCKQIGWNEDNYGITGTLMARAGTSSSDGSSYIDRYAAMGYGDLIVVFGATNDYFWADKAISCEDSEDDYYFENAVHHLCIGLKEKYPGKPIIFLMPYQMRGIGNYFGGADGRAHNGHNTDQKNYVGCTLADYVNMQKSICLSYGMYVLDLYRDFGADVAHIDEDEIRYTIDGCHPNAAGHRRIAALLRDFCIENGLIGDKT